MFEIGFMGLSFQQNSLAVPTFSKFFGLLDSNKPKRIIEIGTGAGIFTIFLGLYCYCNHVDMYSYNIIDQCDKFASIFSGLKINYKIADVFEIMKEIADLIADDGITILLCDGGNKIKEFNTFSEFLKPGDFIFAHDYAKNDEIFKTEMENKYWDWYETHDSAIRESCKKYNLEEYMEEEFNKAAWTCRKKGN